jgi:hypothetical protein
MLRVGLTLSVSSATCEQYFLIMCRMKTWMKTCMHQKHFTNLSILHIEKDLMKIIDSESILIKSKLFENINFYIFFYFYCLFVIYFEPIKQWFPTSYILCPFWRISKISHPNSSINWKNRSPFLCIIQINYTIPFGIY